MNGCWNLEGKGFQKIPDKYADFASAKLRQFVFDGMTISAVTFVCGNLLAVVYGDWSWDLVLKMAQLYAGLVIMTGVACFLSK